MKVLFSLDINCIEEENYWAEYHIGLFKSTDDIDAVLKRLMHEGGKFSKPGCEARISEVEIIGESANVECVYRFYGQNIDSSFEGDIIESPCYLDKLTAIKELMNAKRCTPRQKWNLETLFVGECNW